MAANKIDILKKQLEAFERGDWKTWRSTIADNAVFEEEATHQRVQGADAIENVMKAWKTAFPDSKADIKDVIASGDAVVAELEWQGTHQGPLSGPFGTIPPTGRAGKVSAVLVLRFDNDRVRESRHYFDLLTLLAQLGIMPQPSAQPRTP
jgi:steroid delta-isomerase-like uncharacterized protein